MPGYQVHLGGGLASQDREEAGLGRTVRGLKVEAVSIDPEVIDPTDAAMLEDLVVAATNDALARVQELNQAALGGLDIGGAGGLNLGL